MRHCNEYFDRFGVLIHWQDRQAGDLTFWSRNGLIPTHIGLLINRDWYIHAPGKDGTSVTIDHLRVAPIPYRHENQLYFENPIGFKRLALPNGRWQVVL